MFVPTSYSDIGLLLLRVAVGALFIYHGWPKISGGKQMAQGMGKPSWGSFLTFIGVAETLGGLALIGGFLTQLAAIGLGIIMIGALYLKIAVWHAPFYEPGKGGWEIDMVLLAAAACFVLSGAGGISVDGMLGWWP